MAVGSTLSVTCLIRLHHHLNGLTEGEGLNDWAKMKTKKKKIVAVCLIVKQIVCGVSFKSLYPFKDIYVIPSKRGQKWSHSQLFVRDIVKSTYVRGNITVVCFMFQSLGQFYKNSPRLINNVSIFNICPIQYVLNQNWSYRSVLLL